MTMYRTSDVTGETLIAALLLVSTVLMIIFGGIFMSSKKNEDKTLGITLLIVGIVGTVLVVAGAAFIIVFGTLHEIDSCCTDIGRMG